MIMSRNYITRAGYGKLQQDLAVLMKQKSLLSREIGEAAEKGDLKENAEYHSAKERMADTLKRMDSIQDQLSSASLIDELQIKEGEVQIGVKVILKETTSDSEWSWTLVGASESDPASGRISVDSPLAQGILGHKVGEEVVVDLPAGKKKFKILKTEPAL
ncbi:MAG TPA: transcription elongation factor GreA [Elusimicrobia bacterium]|nr:transcription elongation factor GreA [Elusimicrobiota bacterium]